MNMFFLNVFGNLDFDIYYELMMLCVLIVLGILLGKLAEKLSIPAVTGYIVAGILVGPVLHLVTEEVTGGLKIISNIAIGFIAYSIGMELWLPKYKNSAKEILILTFVQAIMTTVIVFFVFLVFKQSVAVALLLSAIACATAPAPLMMIIKRYKAKGRLTDTVLPVVGLDDGVGIIIFGVNLAVAKALINNGGENINIFKIILTPLKELGLSILLGVIVGLIVGVLSNKVIKNFAKHDKNDTYLSLAIICVFLSVTAAHYFSLSPILVPMVIGMTVTNMIDKDTFKTQTRVIDKFTPPLMIAFFTLAGAELDFKILVNAGLVGIIYILARIIGKYVGSYIGCLIGGSPKEVRNHIGLTLLPQGGVAIGMVITVANECGDVGKMIQTIVLAGIFIYELFGPILAKIGFERTGDIVKGALNESNNDANTVALETTEVSQTSESQK